MTRTHALPLAVAALLAPLAARAQFQPTPLRLRKPMPYESVTAAPLRTSPPSADIVTSLLTGPALSPWGSALFQARALAYPQALPVPAPAIAPAYGLDGGRLRGDGAGGVVWGEVPGAAMRLHVAFGPPPGTLGTFDLPGIGYTLAVAHLVPGVSDAVAVPLGVGNGPTGAGGVVHGVAFDAAGGVLAQADWPVGPASSNDPVTGDLLHAVRLSPAALGAGRVQDLVLPMQDVAFVLWNGGGAAVAPSLLTTVALGNPSNPAAHLPPTVASPVWMHGAAAVDLEQNGAPDLFLAGVPYATGAGTGRLLEVKRAGAPATFQSPWLDVTGNADLQPLPDAQLVRPLDLGTTQGMAVFSAGPTGGTQQTLLVVTPGPAPGRFAVQRLALPGLWVRDVFAADVVGSPAPDLVVDVSTIGTPDVQYVLVFPDTGDAPPTIAWAPGSPGAPVRGADHAVAVDAADPDGTVHVDWILGTSADPVVGTGPSFTIPGADLCDPAALPTVTARATDDVGLYVELSTSWASLGAAPPTLAVQGATPPDRLALVPGGTPASFEAALAPACGGTATFSWSASGFAAPAGTVDAGTTTSRWSVVLPESEYPALLAGGAAVAVSAVDDAGIASQASLPLSPDGGALVDVVETADRAVAPDGGVATVSAVLRSRIGVPLPSVRVAWSLAGLEPAGPPAVTGAAVVSSDASGVVVDALPAAGAAVRVDLPVRVLRAPASAAFRASSQGGFPLGPQGEPAATDVRAPGCACGDGGGGAVGLVALAGAALARRRRRPAT